MRLHNAPGPTLLLDGEYDLDNAHRIIERVMSALGNGPAVIAVDMSRVTFFGSTALGALMQARQACQRAGTRLRIDNPSAAVKRVLELTDTESLFRAGADGVRGDAR